MCKTYRRKYIIFFSQFRPEGIRHRAVVSLQCKYTRCQSHGVRCLQRCRLPDSTRRAADGPSWHCVSAAAASRKQKSRRLHSSWAWKADELYYSPGGGSTCSCVECFRLWSWGQRRRRLGTAPPRPLQAWRAMPNFVFHSMHKWTPRTLYHVTFSPIEYEKSHLQHWPLHKLLEQWNADLTRYPMTQYQMYSLTGSIMETTLSHVLVIGLCSGCWLWQTRWLEIDTGSWCPKHCTKCSISPSWNADYISRWCVLTCMPLLNFWCLSCQYYDGSNLCQC
jgi:hypothetical protein